MNLKSLSSSSVALCVTKRLQGWGYEEELHLAWTRSCLGLIPQHHTLTQENSSSKQLLRKGNINSRATGERLLFSGKAEVGGT